MAIIMSAEVFDTVEKAARLVRDGEMNFNDFKVFLELEIQEIKFWDEYGRIYPELEKATPYKKLLQVFRLGISPQAGESWLDVGVGSGACLEVIWEKSKGAIEKIIALDFSKVMLKHAQARTGEFFPQPQGQIELLEKNLSEPFPEKWHNQFDGITANLVLPYVVRFEKKLSSAGLEALLREMYKVLRPGGQLVWSTPRHKVNFNMVFLASWRETLASLANFKNAIRILKHAGTIQKKGKKEIYTFLPIEEIERIMRSIGFIDLNFQKTFAGQAWVISAYKAQNITLESKKI